MTVKLAAKKSFLQQRARIVQSIRAFFIAQDFLEVETPQRIPANAPEAQISPVGSESWQLHTSPELAMKRLLAAGYERIFQLCHCWRADESGSRHLPEFSILEWYRCDSDYQQLMQDCEELIRWLVPTGEIVYQGASTDLSAPFERLSVAEAFERYTDTTPERALGEDRFDELIAFEIEPRLGRKRPTLLYDYPRELAALARVKPGQPEVAERFELYIAGIELANAFSELTDPNEQRRRFEADAALLAQRTDREAPLPVPFLKDLAALDQAAGIALGIDRLVMLLTNAARIDQVVAFPPEAL